MTGWRINFSLLRSGYLFRWIAVLFFVLIFSDLVMPENCCEGIFESSEVSSGISIISNQKNVFFANSENHSQSDHQSKSSNDNEGCFCSCAHFITSEGFNNFSKLTTISQIELQSCFLPSFPPRSTFHPPRFS
jgi:hypothetical protein